MSSANSEKNCVIAVDLGGTNLVCAIVDRGCTLIERTVSPARADLGSDQAVAHIGEKIVGIARLSGRDIHGFAGIGMGAPGIVSTEDGMIRRAANFPNWQDLPLAQALNERFSVPVCVHHDVDMAVLAEKHYGAGQGRDHILCLTIGTGIGMGMMLNGQLYSGAKAGAGNFGHMIIDRQLSPAGDKTEDHLESLTAGPAIRRQAMEALRQGQRSVLSDLCEGDPENIDTRMVFDAARAGDTVSLRIVREMAWLLGIGIANAIDLLSPEIVIIGGSIALAGEVLFAPLIESVRAYVCPFLRADVNIVPAQLGDNAVLIGAAHTVWQSLAVKA